MKSVKFDHAAIERIRTGDVRTIWRLRDDKNLSVNDEIKLIDKVQEDRPETWRVAGTARIERVIEKRLADVSIAEMTEQGYTSTDEMLTTLNSYYQNDVNLTNAVKIIYFTLTSKESINGDIYTTNIKSVHLYTDGGSRGNPGPSASGFVIIDPEKNTVIVDKGMYLGVTTNNQAEYLALKYGLEEAKKMGAREVTCYLDSMLVVNQMKGIFKIKNRDLWPVHESIKSLAGSFDNVSFTHVPRELNKLADAAVNRALDEGLGIIPAKKPS